MRDNSKGKKTCKNQMDIPFVLYCCFFNDLLACYEWIIPYRLLYFFSFFSQVVEIMCFLNNLVHLLF